jgi:DNA polymerase III epsilon subunit-like protein
MLLNYLEFLNESIKYLSPSEIEKWLFERRDKVFIAVDTETTGLEGPRKEQITQISGVAFKYDPDTMTFEELDHYNQKIKLTPETIIRKNTPGTRVKSVLGFTRYGVRKGNYIDEQEALNRFFDFVNKFGETVLIIQNAPFDMPLINIRRKLGGMKKEIFDSKEFFGYLLLPTLQKMAENGDAEAKNMLDKIGRTSSGIPTSSLPKIAPALGVEAGGAHDALFDCRYTVKTLERALDIVMKNKDLDIKKYIVPRISSDRYIKQKNKSL